MRTTRWKIALVSSALIGAHASAPALAAQDTEPDTLTPAAADAILYPVTLEFGTGLMDIPVAWISPKSGDVWPRPPADEHRLAASVCTDQHLREVELELHDRDALEAAFLRGALGLQQQSRVGFLRPVPRAHREGGQLEARGRGRLPEPRSVHARGAAPDRARRDGRLARRNTPYRSGLLAGLPHGAHASTAWPPRTGRWADRHLRRHARLRQRHLQRQWQPRSTITTTRARSSRGSSSAGDTRFHPGENWTMNFMVENNGWDWNAGMVVDWRGIFLGFYGTELEEGSMTPAKGAYYQVYNYTKFSLNIGFSTNVFLASQGTMLRSEVSDLQREQQQLNSEIAQHEKKIGSLENRCGRRRPAGSPRSRSGANSWTRRSRKRRRLFAGPRSACSSSKGRRSRPRRPPAARRRVNHRSRTMRTYTNPMTFTRGAAGLRGDRRLGLVPRRARRAAVVSADALLGRGADRHPGGLGGAGVGRLRALLLGTDLQQRGRVDRARGARRLQHERRVLALVLRTRRDRARDLFRQSGVGRVRAGPAAERGELPSASPAPSTGSRASPSACATWGRTITWTASRSATSSSPARRRIPGSSTRPTRST